MEELKVKVVEVSQEKEQPQGNDYIRVTVEIDGRKIAVWVLQNDIQYLADGGGSSPIQTKATIKMIKVFNTQPQRNFSLFRSAS